MIAEPNDDALRLHEVLGRIADLEERIIRVELRLTRAFREERQTVQLEYILASMRVARRAMFTQRDTLQDRIEARSKEAVRVR
jgi:hypothetical protein